MSNKRVQEVNQISFPAASKAKVLFLGYKTSETKIIQALIDYGCEVWHTSSSITSTQGFDVTISFGYRHILEKTVIECSSTPIINLHISYLPYNRGAHPNFWSFYEGTPSGVSIHLMDAGIDTGPILFQQYANFPHSAITFAQTYKFLFELIEKLFIENIDSIITKKYKAKKQRHKGTYHCSSDLPTDFLGWDAVIEEEIERLEKLILETQSEKLKLIDEIENIRRANNINWMDLLRLAFRESPIQAKELVRRINNDDNKISDLFAKLSQ